MKKSFSLHCFFIAICGILSAQELRYDVIRNNKSMGETVVNRKINGDEIIYYLSTKTKFKILFTIEVQYDLLETFNKAILQSGTGFNTLNGSMQKETSLSRKSDHYELIIDGITTQIQEKNITESVSEIYFEEPTHKKKLFSAYFGRFLSVEKIGDHQYSLTSPDGTNTYTYENGTCIEVKINRDFATFSQILKPELLKAVRERSIR